VTAVALDKAGRTLATASGTTVQVFDLSARDPTRPLLELAAAQRVASLTMDPMGNQLVIGDREGNLSLHDLRTNARRWLKRHDDEALAVRIFESEGRSYVASGGKDQTARVWDAETGRELARLRHAAAVRAIDVSPDGRLLVTGADDRTTRIFLWRPKDLLFEAESRLRDAPAADRQGEDTLASVPRLSLDRIKQWLARP
jgi:WD40 repeat protein